MAGKGNTKGNALGAGRKKGTPNKVTADIRQMVINTLHAAGGEKYLLQQARDNPNSFLTLVSKAMPQNVNIGGQKDNPVVVTPLVELKQRALLMRQKYADRMNIIENQPTIN